MSIKKTYDGYTAFDYLKGDFHKFEMAPEVDRVPPFTIELDSDDEDKVARILKDNLYISVHEHPNMTVLDLAKDGDSYIHEGRDYFGYKALSDCHYDVIFDNMLDGTAVIHSKNGWKWSEIIHDLGIRLCDIAHQNMLIPVYKIDDMYKAKAENRIGIVFVVEGAAPIENEVDRVDVLYGLGIRQMGITYSQSNALGTGLKEDRDGGLTAFGKKVVKRMNDIGMAIDCSHSGIKTTLDVVEYSEKPIIMSHVGARALWDIKRLAPDEVFKEIAARGGIIGIEAAPHTTISRSHKSHSIDSVMDHFKYIVDLVGIDHVTFGPDTLYGDHVGIHDFYASQFSDKNKVQLDYPKQKYVKGLENPTEASRNIIRALVKEGFTDEDVIKAIGGNTLRALKEIWIK